MNTDQIVKRIVLKAPRERVWRAVSDSDAFGSWFGVKFSGPFTIGAPMTGRIVPTQVDPEVAKLQEPHAGQPFQIWVECIEPMRRFAFRWHPYAIDPDSDYAKEPTTLVTFELSDADDGTQLTITESGFDRIPVERRAQAFESNEGGWAHQTKLIEKYLLQSGGAPGAH
jgi:uncharacterized protein YndB with AHSA1/START domain